MISVCHLSLSFSVQGRSNNPIAPSGQESRRASCFESFKDSNPISSLMVMRNSSNGTCIFSGEMSCLLA